MDLTNFRAGHTGTVHPAVIERGIRRTEKQEREEIWGMIDGKAQEVFQNGDSLKGFLDFMGQCKPQRTDNLFLLYAQNPEIRQVKTFENGRKKAR